MTVEANKQLYRRWLLELWDGNLAITDQIVTPDFVGSWPGRPGLVHGPKELADIIRMSRAIFQEVTFAVEVGPVADGELVAARWIGHGRYKGGMRAATAPAGTRVSFSGHDLLRVDDGRFAEYWVISETEHLLAQLQPNPS
ncbi:MAG TPA: ester cyclase [Actinomycetota bacterium]|nr:ester cyclase [Actinomycetota bacterium]